MNKKTKCEFCGNEKELGNSTPFHGFYCLDCMKMNLKFEGEAIAEMKQKRRRKVSVQELEQIEKEKDDALNLLMNFECTTVQEILNGSEGGTE